MRPMPSARWSLLLLAVMAGCDSPNKPTPVASVVVTPSTASVVVSTPQPFTAATRDAQGIQLTGRAVAWSSSNTAVATVASNGVVTTLTPGSATISAVSENVTGTATLTVRPVPIASISV